MRKMISLLLAIAMILSMASVAFAAEPASFIDVDVNAYYYDAVNWAVANEVTSGIGDGLFAPGNTCTRSEIAAFLWKYAGQPEPTAEKSEFVDVTSGDWFYNPVLWAVEGGVTNGTSEGVFSPKMMCTRDQIVTFLWKYAGQPAAENAENPFEDVEEGSWYYDAVLWAVEMGITTGKSATSFDPKANCSRGEIVTFLYRFAMRSNLTGLGELIEEGGDVTVTNGITQLFGGNLYGLTMTIENADKIEMIYNGEVVKADNNGSITITFPKASSGGLKDPVQFIIKNPTADDITLSFSFVTPVGDLMNPAALKIGDNAAPIEQGDTDGYYYSWIATADGKLTITMKDSAWTYSVDNMTAYVYGDSHKSDDSEAVPSETIDVKKGDEIRVIVSTYNPEDPYNAPAGTLNFTATFAEGTGSVDPIVPVSKDIVILYTNDVHTYIDGEISYDNIADLKTKLSETADVLLVDAGDHVQGTAYGSMDKGDTIIELMNAAGYDLATLGNHEFDYGMEKALANVEAAEFPYVSANFYHEANGVKGESVLDAYKIFEIGDEKIAFVGITTPETFTKSTPAYFQDENGNYIYGISGGTDGAALYADVQTAIDAAEAAGATTIIALGHLGDDPASKPWTSEELIANVSGLDAFIDGHSHSTVVGKEVADKDGEKVLLTQTGEYFGAIGKMTINEESISTELITAYEGSDEAVAKIKNDWMNAVDEELGTVIGYAEVTFDNYDAEGNRLVRSQETNTGDFAADALYYLFDNMDLDVDVAIMNGGGVRNKTITGEISYKTCKEIHTFGNVACLQTITGQQLLDALEWGAKDAGTSENGGFLHVSGVKYEIDTSIASTVQKDDKGVWTGGPTGEYRVKNVKILQDGEYVDLDLTAKYNLAGYNYTLRDLGDGFAMFGGAVNVLDYVMEDYMVLANYVQSFEKGENGLPTITAENSPYEDINGEGRITVITAE